MEMRLSVFLVAFIYDDISVLLYTVLSVGVAKYTNVVLYFL